MSLSKISYLIVPGKSLNHLFHDDFVGYFIFCKSQRCTTRIAFSPYLVPEIWFCQKLLGKDLTRCFMIISMCVVHSLSISSLRPKRKSVHYESFENCISKFFRETVQITCFMVTSMSVAYSATFNPVRHKPNYVPTESLQNPFCQKFLETDQTRCFILIVMSVGNWFSFSVIRRITNSLYSIADGNSSNDFFHDDFNVCGIFSKLLSLRRRSEFSPKRVTVNLLLSDIVGN